MKSKIITLLFIAISGTLLSVSCEKGNGDINIDDLPDPIAIELRGSETEMMKADQKFAFDFFSKVFAEEAAEEDKNFMVSPLSLSMALAMTWNGAEGSTKTEMQNTLGFEGFSDQEVNEYYKKLKEALLKTDPSTKLAIANSIWTNKHIQIKPNFLSNNREYFNSTVESVDFDDLNTVKRINQWAADNTNNLIKDVLKETDPMALMYLLNAIYFKGIWTSEFEPNKTSSKPFYYEDGGSKNVEMMHQKDEFNYTANKTMQVVQLPYGNQAFSMIVMLPMEGQTIADVTNELQKEGVWTGIVGGLRGSEVDLYLPKFKTRYSKRLNGVLNDMGIVEAFNPNLADFSEMSDVESFISSVQQFTYIATDEVGTEAAAVTVVGMMTTALPIVQTVTFNANRPFIYVIQENSTGAVLFMGAVKNFDE